MSSFFSQVTGRDVSPKEVLSVPVQFESIVTWFSPTPWTEEVDVQVVVRLCDTDQLDRLTKAMEPEQRRECYLRAGHYEQAKGVDGWEEFAGKPYPWTDADFQDMGITNAEAYGLCDRLQKIGVVGNSPANRPVQEHRTDSHVVTPRTVTHRTP